MSYAKNDKGYRYSDSIMKFRAVFNSKKYN